MGVIDEAAIDRLFLVGELTKNICLSANKATDEEGGASVEDGAELALNTEEELAQFFPPFVWLLRDFALRVQKDGVDISLAEDMENSLEDRPVQSNNCRSSTGRLVLLSLTADCCMAAGRDRARRLRRSIGSGGRSRSSSTIGALDGGTLLLASHSH